MTRYHQQCQHCYCTTSLWEENDGSDREINYGDGDCGCQDNICDDCGQDVHVSCWCDDD